ncbi:MAG: hypothetical protein K2I07_03345 [Lachnospiraceae bacterium]|nr:hypothetical protein [Lachnospiraceae bacterium]
MGVREFNVTSLSKVRLLDPHDVGYEDSIDIIRDELHRTRRSFVKIGWYLKHIKDQEMFKTDGYADIFELALDKFNISQPTATRFMNICKEFSVNHDSPELDEKFVDFSVSQLFEMLPMEEEKREQITSDMTVKQIREVKEDTRKKNEPDDGEIRAVCHDCLRKISDNDFEHLKEYMCERYGKSYHFTSSPDLSYRCTPKGISINNSDEITWTSFAKRAHYLNDLIPFRVHRDDDSEIPGQTSIEKDFPEYLPAKQKATELQAEQEEISTAPKEVMTGAEMTESENIEPEILEGDYRELPEASADIEKTAKFVSGQILEVARNLYGEICITGKSENGRCNLATYCDKGLKCCAECQEYCIARCGWLQMSQNNEEAEQIQPELPDLKNADQRKAWLADYKSWGLWYYDEHIDVNYYKYDFSDGSRLIVAEYPQRQEYWSSKIADEYHYHLLEKGKKRKYDNKPYDEKFRAHYDNETHLIEFLKDLKMGKRGISE